MLTTLGVMMIMLGDCDDVDSTGLLVGKALVLTTLVVMMVMLGDCGDVDSTGGLLEDISKKETKILRSDVGMHCLNVYKSDNTYVCVNITHMTLYSYYL